MAKLSLEVQSLTNGTETENCSSSTPQLFTVRDWLPKTPPTETKEPSHCAVPNKHRGSGLLWLKSPTRSQLHCMYVFFLQGS